MIAILIFLLSVLFAAGGALSFAATPQNSAIATAATISALRQRVEQAKPLRLYYYVDDQRSFESLQAHAAGIDVLAPQAFWIDPQGALHGQIPARVLELAGRAGIPLMPLVFNQRFNRATVSAVLENPAARALAIQYLPYLAWRNHCVGFQIDFENIAPQDRQLYSEFVRQAAAALHRYGMLLSVALVPRFSDLPYGASKPGKAAPGQWAAAFDYRALGDAADFVTLMAYDNFGREDPPGPIAGFDWVNRALAFALSRIPASKILLGIPLYGREWAATRHGYSAHSLTFADIDSLLVNRNLDARWDARGQAPWFRYRAGGSVRTVYFENDRSLREKLGLVPEFHLKGYAAWRIGSESPSFWTLVGHAVQEPRATETPTPVRPSGQ